MENEGMTAAPAGSPDPAPVPPLLATPPAAAQATQPPGPPPHHGSRGPARPEGPRRGGRGWMLATFLLAAVVLMLLMAQFGSWLASFGAAANLGHSRKQFHETVFREGHARDKILLIDLFGIIADAAIDAHGRTHVSWIKDQLEHAGEDRAVKAVILRVDSPGGEVLASDDIYRAIDQFQRDTGKPVVASMGGLAASGGYYVSAPCRWIVANELTITGSIGVIMSSYNYRGLMDKVGVRPDVYKSGKFKDMLSPDRTVVSEEEREMVQGLVNETFGRFKDIVRAGRQQASKLNRGKGRTLVEGWQDYADGRIFSGKHAYELGFVDELGDFDAAVERAQELAGIHSADLVRYQLELDFADLFRLFGRSEAKSVKVDLGMDMPRLQTGRLYFLAPTLAP